MPYFEEVSRGVPVTEGRMAYPYQSMSPSKDMAGNRRSPTCLDGPGSVGLDRGRSKGHLVNVISFLFPTSKTKGIMPLLLMYGPR